VLFETPFAAGMAAIVAVESGMERLWKTREAAAQNLGVGRDDARFVAAV